MVTLTIFTIAFSNQRSRLSGGHPDKLKIVSQHRLKPLSAVYRFRQVEAIVCLLRATFFFFSVHRQNFLYSGILMALLQAVFCRYVLHPFLRYAQLASDHCYSEFFSSSTSLSKPFLLFFFLPNFLI